MKKNNNRGFTLAELLIVVAIIAVLVAVAIPVFTTQLEKSRDATSIANLRSAYAEASTAMLVSDGKAVAKTGEVTVNAAANDKQTVTVSNIALKGQSTGFSGLQTELPFINSLDDSSAQGGTPGAYTATFEWDLKANTCTLNSLTAGGGTSGGTSGGTTGG